MTVDSWQYLVLFGVFMICGGHAQYPSRVEELAPFSKSLMVSVYVGSLSLICSSQPVHGFTIHVQLFHVP